MQTILRQQASSAGGGMLDGAVKWKLDTLHYHGGDVRARGAAACNGRVTCLPLRGKTLSEATRLSMDSLAQQTQELQIGVADREAVQELVVRALRATALDVSTYRCRCFLAATVQGLIATRHPMCATTDMQQLLALSSPRTFHQRLDNDVVPQFRTVVMDLIQEHRQRVLQEVGESANEYLNQLQLTMNELQQDLCIRCDPVGQLLASLLDRWIVVLDPELDDGDHGVQPSCPVQIFAPHSIDITSITEVPCRQAVVLLYSTMHYMALPVPINMRVLLMCSQQLQGALDRDIFDSGRVRMARGQLLLGDAGSDVEAALAAADVPRVAAVSTGDWNEVPAAPAVPAAAPGVSAAAPAVPGPALAVHAAAPAVLAAALAVPCVVDMVADAAGPNSGSAADMEVPDSEAPIEGTVSTAVTHNDANAVLSASDLSLLQQAKELFSIKTSDFNRAVAPYVAGPAASQRLQDHLSGAEVAAPAAGFVGCASQRKRKAENSDRTVGNFKAPCQGTDQSPGALRGGSNDTPAQGSPTEVEDIFDNLYKRVFEGAELSEVQQALSAMDESTLHEMVPFAIYCHVAGGHKPNEVLEELLAAVHNKAARPAVNVALGFAAEFGLFDTFKMLYSRYGFTTLDMEEAASEIVTDHSWLHGVPYYRPKTVIQGVLLQLAIESATSGSYKLVRLLLDDGALADQVNELGNLPLNIAAKEDDTYIMSLLLAKGADTSARDAFGRTALDVAAEHGHRKAVELLLQLHTPEADALAPALQSALRGGHADVAALFLALETMHTFDPMVYDTYNPVIDVVLARDERSLQVLLSNYASHASLASLDDATKARLDGVFSIVSVSLHMLIEIGQKQGTISENTARFTILEAIVKDIARNLVRLWWEAVSDYSSAPRLLDVIAACESTKCSLALLLNADTDLESVLAAAFARHYEEDSEADSRSEAASSCSTGSEADMEPGAAGDGEAMDSDSARDSDAESESEPATHLLWCIGEGSTVLHELVRLGESAAVQRLLDAGASVAAVDIDRHTPLHVAAACGKAEIVKLLIKEEANVNAASVVGTTPLMMAAGAAVIAVDDDFDWQYFPSTPDSLQALLERGADLAAVNILGWNALHYAVAIDCAMAVDVLSNAMLEAGADVDVHDVAGYTPLHLAAMLGHTEVADLLLKAGARVTNATSANGTSYPDVPTRHRFTLNVLDPPVDQWQCLHIAAYFGEVDMIKLLMQHGAPVNSASGDGESALHLAMREGQHEVVELLLLCGATVHVPDGEEPAPLQIAAKSADHELGR